MKIIAVSENGDKEEGVIMNNKMSISELQLQLKIALVKTNILGEGISLFKDKSALFSTFTDVVRLI